jgi:hypothetical protein
MSTQSISNQGGSQLFVNSDRRKIFIGNNRTQIEGVINNDEYDPVTIPAGTLLGRVTASKKLIPLASGASDGSQVPVGILLNDVTIEEGGEETVAVVVAGDVWEQGVVLNGSDNMDTMISARTIRDRIQGDTVGIKLVPAVDNMEFDNA